MSKKDDRLQGYGIAPNAAPVTVEPDGWYQIAPYGEWPTVDGRFTQVFGREQAEAMVRTFNSTNFPILRWLASNQVPVFVGHPDVDRKAWPDDRMLAVRHTELEARADGLWGRAEWNAAGRENIEEGYWRFPSPVWLFPKPKTGERRVYPDLLQSVGLTNFHNIPDAQRVTFNAATDLDATDNPDDSTMNTQETHEGATTEAATTETETDNTAAAAANAATETEAETETETEIEAETETETETETVTRTIDDFGPILAALGLEEGAPVAEIVEAIEALRSRGDAAETEKAEAMEAANAATATLETITAERDQAANALAEFRAKAAESLIDAAVLAGRCTKAEMEGWAERFEADFEVAANAILTGEYPTDAAMDSIVVQDIGALVSAAKGNGAAALDTPAARIAAQNAAVAERQAAMGIAGPEGYTLAWNAVRKERPDLFRGPAQAGDDD